jgi:hypothetical protein
METRDRIGRRRQPHQSRGLRPLFPKLPTSFESRAVRIAMTTPAWSRIDSLMAERIRETRPRALGEVIETLLAVFDATATPPWAGGIDSSETSRLPASADEQSGSVDWQDWQIRKERALLPAMHAH